jgi:tRNA-specific 2-thiouridylase
MDAQRSANKIGIPFYVWDFSERFKQEVVDDFIQEYQAGRTPNPCMRCNERIKFAALLEKALALGFDALCTGHYASIEQDPYGNLELHRSTAMAKDQSYVLGVLTTQQLKHSLFPLGKAATKEDVRVEADKRELSVAKKPDSYDICFIPDGDTRKWLSDKVPRTEGAILDHNGQQLATHDGAVGFTVGQRKGLNISKPAADGKPRYVLSIRPKDNVVVVGPDSALLISELSGTSYTWCGMAPENAGHWFEAEVQVRAHGESHPCQVRVEGDLLRIKLQEPIRGISSGQTAVIYLGSRVLGQTTIDQTTSAVMEQV